MTRRAVLLCPGRGTYNRAELGYIGKHHGQAPALDAFDAIRREAGQEGMTDLDGAKSFSASKYSSGSNASPLIYTSSLLDSQALADDIEIVATGGNSLGWYIALAAGGTLSPEDGFRVVNGMGTLMQDNLIGGQLVYPFMDKEWRDPLGRKAELAQLIAEIDSGSDCDLTISIHLGGMLVLAGNEAGLAKFEQAVPVIQDRFPLRLPNHAAFHSHLQKPVALQAQSTFTPAMFSQPKVPLIDGRGVIWWPHSSDTDAMWRYTFGHQITKTFDFSRVVQTAAREFAPDVFIVTGPGNTMGGAVAQSLIEINWQGMTSKSDFTERQKSNPIILSMGLEDQRPATTP